MLDIDSLVSFVGHIERTLEIHIKYPSVTTVQRWTHLSNMSNMLFFKTISKIIVQSHLSMEQV